MRSSLWLILASVLPFTVVLLLRHHWDQTAQASQEQNNLGLFVPVETIDLGRVWSGQGIRRTFHIISRGNAPAEIEHLSSDCGCTVPSVPGKIIQPGEDFPVNVTFWPGEPDGNSAGSFVRTVTADLKMGQEQTTVRLRLTGLIEPTKTLRAFPLNIDVGDYVPGHSPQKQYLHLKATKNLLDQVPDELHIVPGQDIKIIVGMPSQDDDLAQKDIEVFVEPGGEAAQQNWTSRIQFRPDSQSEGLTINVRGRIAPTAEYCVPSSILISGIDGSETAELKSVDGSDFYPSSVSTELPLVVNYDVADAKWNEWRLTIKIQNHPIPDAKGSIIVNVKTSRSEDKIVIPVVILNADSAGTNPK